MQDGNRPYALNDVHDKFGKDHGKTALQKVLDTLVSQGKLFEKIYGKQKIYCAVQKTDKSDPEKSHQELRDLNAEFMKLEQSVKEKTAQLNRLEQELKKGGLTKSASELKAENLALKTELNEIDEKAKRADQKARSIKLAPKFNPSEQKAIEKDYEKCLAAYKKRKAMCREMIDTIMEAYPGSKKKLLDDLGIEADEDVGFVFEPV